MFLKAVFYPFAYRFFRPLNGYLRVHFPKLGARYFRRFTKLNANIFFWQIHPDEIDDGEVMLIWDFALALCSKSKDSVVHFSN